MKMLKWMLVFAFCLPVVLSAQSMQEIKQRMADRLPTISELKEKQLVGENYQGFLEVLEPEKVSDEQKEAVNAENDDRKIVYAKIADQVDATLKLVGQQRAESIREQSAPGIMIQQPDGTWAEKKTVD
ncbi:MAG: YdbL family protein [Verrucomicrobiota bacterium]